MPLIDPGNLIAVQISHCLRHLSGAEVAAVGEDCDEIPHHLVDKFGIVTGKRPEVTRPVKPSFGIRQ